MTTQVSSHQQVQAKSTVSIVAQSLAALAFGMIIIFAVGFAPMEVAHNAAHDTRHGHAFPCH
jgi:cobalt transporter subunit CbtB